MKFQEHDRIVVIAEEPDPRILQSYGAIPVGTTGRVIQYSGVDENPQTGEREPYISCVFDLPYMGNENHRNVNGRIGFDVFESMIELADDKLPAIDLAMIF